MLGLTYAHCAQFWAANFFFFLKKQWLDIDPSYNPMKRWVKKWQKTNFGPNFNPFGLNLGPKTFFWAFYLYYVLETVTSYR